ncbi:rhomboid family intramembrane serine protease [Bacillus sp. HMF5848]|uniref:rhomboid family intramembrane serine protease n=1 Tax=Bacillus sp. HMF5848 TaxID=2495421 RepID=UPI000F783316|nr:rhomboid family intramembrane serine protease [Bacillus sp. HMF5848]RSK27845.1 rhomboid family intramembrane serine protease [Bacillus sp. HMF5848]
MKCNNVRLDALKGEGIELFAYQAFWELAHQLVVQNNYRIIQISEDQRELWLENRSDKNVQVVRLLQYDLDWANWMARDIEDIIRKMDRVRKHITRRKITVANVYVSTYPPVDDWEHLIEKSQSYGPNEQVKMQSFVLDEQNSSLSSLSHYFDKSITLQFDRQGDLTEGDRYKYATLKVAADNAKFEKKVFQQSKRPFFTFFFIILQVLMFLVVEWYGSSTDVATLISFGAKYNPFILAGEWWRFFTPIILHITFLHLFMNTLALFYLGIAVEKLYGNGRFLFIYLLAGFTGSVASFLFSPVVSAGASGAIYGLFGALLYFGVVYPSLFFRTMGLNLFFILGINLVFGLVVPVVDNAGHLGGLVGGFLASAIVSLPKKSYKARQVTAFLMTIALISGSIWYGFTNKQASDWREVAQIAQEYANNRQYEQAHKIINAQMPLSASDDRLFMMRGVVFIQEGQYDSAIIALQKAIELNNTMHEVYFYLAQLYAEKNELNKAIEYVETAITLDPKNTDYKELLERIKEYMRGS